MKKYAPALDNWRFVRSDFLKNFCLHGFLFSGDLNTNVDFSDFIFVKIYSKFDVRKQKLSLNHKKIKTI
jgi:hypothetical protein